MINSASPTLGAGNANASLGPLVGRVVEVCHGIPAPLTAVVHPAGSAGAVTPSKFSERVTPQGVGMGVAVAGAKVGVAVGVGGGGLASLIKYEIVIESMYQPTPASLQSVARRKRKTTLCPWAARGNWTKPLTNPPELPVQAGRPAIGFRNPVEIVPL